MPVMRLDRFLANAGCGTRSEVKQLLKKGMVTVNCARTSAKRASKNAALSLDEISEIIPANEEKSETLLAYVFALPEKYRTVLYLFYYEDMKISDISNTLGISESAVKLRLRRGREKLKAILERESYNEF